MNKMIAEDYDTEQERADATEFFEKLKAVKKPRDYKRGFTLAFSLLVVGATSRILE